MKPICSLMSNVLNFASQKLPAALKIATITYYFFYYRLCCIKIDRRRRNFNDIHTTVVSQVSSYLPASDLMRRMTICLRPRTKKNTDYVTDLLLITVKIDFTLLFLITERCYVTESFSIRYNVHSRLLNK